MYLLLIDHFLISSDTMTDRDNHPFQIRLSLKGNNNHPTLKSIIQKTKKANQKIVTIAPLMSMGELLELAHNIFGIPRGETYHLEFYAGFPPQKIDLADPGSKASLVTANGIRGGDAVTVTIELQSSTRQSSDNSASSDALKASNRKRPLSTATITDSTCVSEPETAVRPKRAAAKAASESFQSVIRHQDKILREEKQKSKQSPAKKQSNHPGRKLSTANPTRAAAAAHSRKMAALPGGRRLADDSSDHSTPVLDHPSTMMGHSSVSTRRKLANNDSLFKGIQSEDDVSFALISSLESGGFNRHGKVSKILRASMRKTVEKSYEASRAAVRHSSISSGKVEFLQTANGTTENVNNEMGTCTVQYPKNVEGRGFYQEQVHIITIEMLKAVVQAVYDDHQSSEESSSSREMLKPQNMALLSPRVFWSLWYHYHDKSSSMEGSLELLLPNLDWSFLYHRSRQLSEKAKENLRQANEEKMEPKDTKDGNVLASIRAVEQVENAMATMYDETLVDARQRMAEAALARLGKQSKIELDDWVLKTPMDIDEDELEECMLESSENVLERDVLQHCIGILISKLTINNWRVLANSTTDDVCRILQDENIQVSKELVERWISSAQTRSIEEIMLEIIDGNQDLYEILSVELSSSTPKDLSLWRDVPSMIVEEASSQVTVSEDDLQKYCNRARKALDSLGWLELYSTSIGTTT